MILGNFEGWDVVIVVGVAILLFGGSAIPKLARNLGSAKTEFEKGLKTSKESTESTGNDGSSGPRAE
jgi:sec-independent protein translocase protein TatA